MENRLKTKTATMRLPNGKPVTMRAYVAQWKRVAKVIVREGVQGLHPADMIREVLTTGSPGNAKVIAEHFGYKYEKTVFPCGEDCCGAFWEISLNKF